MSGEFISFCTRFPKLPNTKNMQQIQGGGQQNNQIKYGSCKTRAEVYEGNIGLSNKVQYWRFNVTSWITTSTTSLLLKYDKLLF